MAKGPIRWRPVRIQDPPPQPTEERWRTIVSRITMLATGLLLLFAAWKCAGWTLAVARDAAGGGDVTLTLGIVALVLGLLGAALALGGLMPTRFLEMIGHQIGFDDDHD